MNVADVLRDTPASELDLSRHVRAQTDDTVAQTIERMAAADHSCALILRDAKLAGVFTQRDVLMRVVGEPGSADHTIAELMTEAPLTIEATQSVADALAIMNEHRVRSVPVVQADGGIVGNVSIYVLMELIAKLLADRSLRTPTEVSAHHGLEFVDFTGLNTSSAVMVQEDETVAAAVHQMKSRAIGSVFVVDHREHLVGILTEFDLLGRGAWSASDLDAIAVSEIMTPDPVSLSARSSIAEALQRMAESGFSHVPLLGESGRPNCVASFRDVADYLETSLRVLD